MHEKERGTLYHPSSVFNPEDWLRFIETRVFSQKWKKFELNDETLRELQVAIMLGPERHPVMDGTGGLRKVRFADENTNQGKRGSYRACFVYFPDYHIVFLVTMFGKNEKDDLTKAEKNAIAGLIR